MFQPSTKLFQSGEQLENNERTTSDLTVKNDFHKLPNKETEEHFIKHFEH